MKILVRPFLIVHALYMLESCFICVQKVYTNSRKSHKLKFSMKSLTFVLDIYLTICIEIAY